MKVVSVLTTASRGGAEFAAVELLDALAGRGHEPVLVTNLPELARDRRVRVRPVDLGPKLSRASAAALALRAPLLSRRLRAALERELPYDVLLVHYKKEQLLAALLPARLRPALVWAEWGPVPFPLRRGLPRRLYLAAAERADAIMAVSEGTRDSLRDVGVPAERIAVVPNVVRADEIRFTPEGRARVRERLGIPADAAVVGCISRFHPKKRNDVVVHAVRSLEGAPHLVLAGDGETERELRRLAEPLGERAHFVPTPGGEVADVLSAFDVSVFCPSPTEGAPRAVILALLAERPCLATGREGVAALLDDEVGGIAAPENDPAALAELLRAYLGDSERARAAGRAGRARAEAAFAAPVVAARAEEVLEGARRRGAGRRRR